MFVSRPVQAPWNISQNVYLNAFTDSQPRQVIKMFAKHYLFPSAKTTYGVVLPTDTDPDAIEVLEAMFSDHCTYRVAPVRRSIMAMPEAPDRLAVLGTRLAEGLQVHNPHMPSSLAIYVLLSC